MKKIVSVLLALVTVLAVLQISAEESASVETVVWQETENGYSEYLGKIEGYTDASEGIELNNGNTIRFNDGDGKVEFSVDIPSDSFYNIKLFYRHFGDSSNKIKVGLKIDGNYPFPESEELSLWRFWQNSTDEPQTDDDGNEFSPEQVAVEAYRPQFLRDETGIITEPYKFALSGGKHTVTVEGNEGTFELEKIILEAPYIADKYSTVENEYKTKGYKWFSDDNPIVIEGESAAIKNNKAVIAKSDKSTANITPNSPFKNVINNIGGDNWSSAGDSIIWKVKIDNSGIYKLNFRYQQRGVINGVTYRSLLIDGKAPFAEAETISFPYTTGWSSKMFADENGNSYGIYLEKGEHEIELMCTLGPVAELYKELESIVSSIGNRYLDIIMITGETPDANRDYELFKQIPDFTESLQNDKEKLLSLAEKSENLSGVGGNQAAASFRNMARILENMIKNKYTAHKYVSDYYTNYNTISGWLSDMRSMPLSIDSIELCSENYVPKKNVNNAGKSFLFSIQRFFSSFANAYNTSDDEKTYDLRLWVNWGRDQAQVLNSLVENSFTPKTGFNVKLEIVATSVINGILSGNAPDLILCSSRSTPVNLAMRGALTDLSEFDDFEETLKSFQNGAAEPYYYNGGCYALPDTQSFMIMFYRKDVLEKLELGVPKTWDEFTDATVKILRNNMQVSLPYTKMNGTAAADGGVGSLSLFPTLLTQNGVEIYNDKRNMCNLGSAEAISVFADWTKLYTDYKVLKEANFYNRFRLGTMPLGIASYNLYTQIVTAAPEISDKWGIALVPGTVKSDGSIDRSVSGGGTGAGILKVSKNKEAAWEFLKWWTSSETQYTYSENLECVLGPTGRQMTSNVEAFKNLSWSREDKQILLEQWENVVEIPEVPGSYYLARSVDQAYWEVMNGRTTPKEALVKWAQVANSEIERKIKEYS